MQRPVPSAQVHADTRDEFDSDPDDPDDPSHFYEIAVSLSPTHLLPWPMPLHTATATAEKATTHATSPATQARLKPETFFADGSRIRLIEPMTPEREATLAWCKVAGLDGAWWDLGRCGGPGRRRPQSCSSTRPVGRSEPSGAPWGLWRAGYPARLSLATHSQLPSATQAGLEEEVRHNRGPRPACSTGANPSGRPRLCAPRYTPVGSRV